MHVDKWCMLTGDVVASGACWQVMWWQVIHVDRWCGDKWWVLTGDVVTSDRCWQVMCWQVMGVDRWCGVKWCTLTGDVVTGDVLTSDGCWQVMWWQVMHVDRWCAWWSEWSPQRSLLTITNDSVRQQTPMTWIRSTPWWVLCSFCASAKNAFNSHDWLVTLLIDHFYVLIAFLCTDWSLLCTDCILMYWLITFMYWLNRNFYVVLFILHSQADMVHLYVYSTCWVVPVFSEFPHTPT